MRKYKIGYRKKQKGWFYSRTGRPVPKGIVKHEFRRRAQKGWKKRKKKQRFVIKTYTGVYEGAYLGEGEGGWMGYEFIFGDFIAVYNAKKAEKMVEDWMKENERTYLDPDVIEMGIPYKTAPEFLPKAEGSKLTADVHLVITQRMGKYGREISTEKVGRVKWS